MNSKKKIAFFDFCDTLVKGQTVGLFLEFLFKKQERLARKLVLRTRAYWALARGYQGLEYKNYLLRPYTGLEMKKLQQWADEFFEQVVLPNQNQKIIEKMLTHRRNGDEVAIATGALAVYVCPFIDYYRLDHLVATELSHDQVFHGKIKGAECLGQQKLDRIQHQIDLADYDLVNSFAYSDHVSDYPLLNLVGNSYVVKNSLDQDLSWKAINWKVIEGY